MFRHKNIFIQCVAWLGVGVLLAVPIFLRLWQLEAHETAVKKALNDFAYGKTAVTVSGIIDDEPETKPTAQDFTIHVDQVAIPPSSEKIVKIDTRILVSTKLYPNYSYGDRITVTGKLIVPRNFGDSGGGNGSSAGEAGNSSDNSVASDDREFDYIHYLSKDGIFFTMKNPIIDVVATYAGNPLYATLFSVKESFLKNIRQILGEPEASLAAGEIVGDKASLGKSLADDFRRSGLIHIVILSGYSIAIIADSIQRVLSVVPYLPRSASLFTGALGIMLFGIMIGGKATAVRACIMAIISISAKIMYRDYHALRALFLTAYIMAVQNPYIVPYDASFQVSFTATFGLIMLGKHIEHFLKKYPRLFPERFEIRALITSTLATQIAVAPLLLYMMGDASTVGLIANLIVVPFIPLTLLAIFCTGMAGFIPASFHASAVLVGLGAVSHVFLSYELAIVRFFGTFPYAIITVNNFSLTMMFVVYGFYAATYIILRRRSRLLHQSRVKSSSRSPPS